MKADFHLGVWLISVTSLGLASCGKNVLPEQAAAGTTFTNSIGMELVAVPAGKCKVGAIPPAEDSHGRAPIRDAEILRSFWMGTYEVSQEQWREVMGTTIEEQCLLDLGSDYVPRGPDVRVHAVGDEFPMSWVNWVEAKRFCAQLTRLEHLAGRLPEHLAYDLPTEVQWEFACRAGTKSKRWFGNGLWPEGIAVDGKVIIPAVEPHDQQERLSSYPLDVWHGLHPLRDLVRNPFGLCNMHGGVGELCRDDYVRSPKGPAIERGFAGGGGVADAEKVVRPGGGLQDYGLSEAHERHGQSPADRAPWTGFRVVVVPIVEPAAGVEPRNT